MTSIRRAFFCMLRQWLVLIAVCFAIFIARVVGPAVETLMFPVITHKSVRILQVTSRSLTFNVQVTKPRDCTIFTITWSSYTPTRAISLKVINLETGLEARGTVTYTPGTYTIGPFRTFFPLGTRRIVANARYYCHDWWLTPEVFVINVPKSGWVG